MHNIYSQSIHYLCMLHYFSLLYCSLCFFFIFTHEYIQTYIFVCINHNRGYTLQSRITLPHKFSSGKMICRSSAHKYVKFWGKNCSRNTINKQKCIKKEIFFYLSLLSCFLKKKPTLEEKKIANFGKIKKKVKPMSIIRFM